MFKLPLLQTPFTHREAQKIIHNRHDCGAEIDQYFTNDAEVCLETIYPDKTIWKFLHGESSNTLKFETKTHIIHKDMERLFICKHIHISVFTPLLIYIIELV